jgi:hypothetical protein
VRRLGSGTGVPSPNVQALEATVPSVSAEADPSKHAVRSLTAEVKDAVGALSGGGAMTVTVRVVLAVAPLSSVTVSVTG